MSGALVSKVLASALPPDLKFTAVVLASHANDQGYQIWPSVPEIAYLRGLSERMVQFHLKEFRLMTPPLLVVVKPATQWFPAQYRMMADALPWREPYRPPERQPYLVDPGGESPPGDPPGVKPASPQPGVKSDVPGVKPTSPDPSPRDPSRTHTPPAREDTPPGVKPISPLAGGESLPLIGITPEPGHEAHAWCSDRVCVPKFLHKEFKGQLGGPIAKRAARCRTFYAETLAAHSAPIGDVLKFWRAAFAARFAPHTTTGESPREARLRAMRIGPSADLYERAAREREARRAEVARIIGQRGKG